MTPSRYFKAPPATAGRELPKLAASQAGSRRSTGSKRDLIARAWDPRAGECEILPPKTSFNTLHNLKPWIPARLAWKASMYPETNGRIRAVVPRQSYRSGVWVSLVSVLLATHMVLLGGKHSNHICWGRREGHHFTVWVQVKKEKGDLICTSQAKSRWEEPPDMGGLRNPPQRAALAQGTHHGST